MLKRDELYYLLQLVERERELKGKFLDKRVLTIADKLRAMIKDENKKVVE